MGIFKRNLEKVIIAILFFVILILATLYYQTYSELKNSVNVNLQNEEKIAEISTDLTKSETQIRELKMNLISKSDEIVQLNLKISNYEDDLNEAITYIKALVEEVNKEKARKIPSGYYNTKYNNYANNVQGLSEYLTYGFELPTSYVLNVFDCSESAAYLEWSLEQMGFDSKIVIGQAPFDSSSYHAWVIVNTNDGYRTAIEATLLTNGLEKWEDRIASLFTNTARGVIYFDENNAVSKKYYYSYEAEFEDIYEAIEATNFEEWNWWAGVWGLN